MTSITLRAPRFGQLMSRRAHGLNRIARRFDTWLASRKAAAAARRDLSQMSEYELVDIGLRPWDVETVARGGSPRSVDEC